MKRVDLGENRFGCQGCEAIAPFLETNTSIEYFDLSMNGAMLVLPQKTVDSKGLRAIADALKVLVRTGLDHWVPLPPRTSYLFYLACADNLPSYIGDRRTKHSNT